MDQREFSSRGGHARMEGLSLEERRELGRKAGLASARARAKKKKAAKKTRSKSKKS